MFNGSSLTFSAAIARLVGCHYKANGQVVEVTEPEDLNKLFEVGQVDLEVTAKVKRMPAAAVAVGTKDELAVVWADGSTTPLPGTWTVTANGGGGDENSPISGDITFKPTVPDTA
jgi:hypothetical protein